MLKLAGILFTSIGIALAGFFKSVEIKEGMLIRKALLGLVIHIRDRIEASSQPLSHIYASFNSSVLEKTGFIQYLKSGETDALSHALDNTRQSIPEELYGIYRNFSESLGKSRSAYSEAKLINDFAEAIRKEEEILTKKDETKLVLYRKLGILAGLLAALLLA